MTHPEKTYYPHYSVLKHKDEWDEHTRRVIQERLKPKHADYFTAEERETLTDLSHHLLPSHLGEISINIIELFEERCAKGAVRGYPTGAFHTKLTIIQAGLQHIKEFCMTELLSSFTLLKKADQHQLIEQWFQEKKRNTIWTDVTAHEFMTTLTGELIPLVYSDPAIWSQIGYGGPAYPHGYYAFGPKQFDKSEAPLHDKNSSR